MSDLVQEIELEPGAPPVVLRQLASDDDYARCEALQQVTWGEDFAEIVRPTMMMICQKVGGLVAGAFDSRGELLGCIVGLTGLDRGRPVHWSHLMAVRDEVRGRGLGRRLKLYQRRFLLELGVQVARWSYDPLVARNAYLNLVRLGAEPVEYVRNLYGEGDENELHRGIGTDRFIVEWWLDHPRVERALAGGLDPPSSWDRAPVVNVAPSGEPLDGGFDLPDAAAVRVAAPAEIQAVKRRRPDLAVAWRRSTRHAFEGYLARGYLVRGFLRGAEGCFYVLERGRAR